MMKDQIIYSFGLWITTLLLMITGCNNEEPYTPVLKVDNVGYDISEKKIAMVSDTAADSFFVIDKRSGESVYSAALGKKPEYDHISGDLIRPADFSEVSQPGVYVMRLNGAEEVSSEFAIKDDPYSIAALTALRSFYVQRCGTRVTNSSWSRPYCHMEKAAFYHDTDRYLDSSGGWHDAGDYNKFTITHNITLAYLLHQYLDHPDRYRDKQLNIPESGNGIPDILDEAKWGLQWLMKMQREDGGLYHKVSIKQWSGEHLPQNEKDQQYVFEVSSTGTAGAAAVLALASRVFMEHDGEFSQELKERALRAWSFLNENRYTFPLGGFVNPPDVSGGEYGDNNDTDERMWASVEIYKITGDPEDLDYFHLNYNDFWNQSYYVLSWKDLRNLSYYSYLELDPGSEGVDPAVLEELERELIEYADKIVRNASESKYRYALKNDEFYWGSNSIALGYAFDLIQAYKRTGSQNYREAAMDQLHYILGRNPLGISFVTGVGSHAVSDPYHQLSKLQGVGIPVPGMLVGGANYVTHLNDRKISSFTAKNYEDRFENYMVNEPAINYTASFSYVAGYFSKMSLSIN